MYAAVLFYYTLLCVYTCIPAGILERYIPVLQYPPVFSLQMLPCRFTGTRRRIHVFYRKYFLYVVSKGTSLRKFIYAQIGSVTFIMSEFKIPFQKEKHVEYIRKISADVSSFEYLVTQHLRMSGVYWGLTALCLLGLDIKAEPSYSGMVEWIMSCQDPTSGG